MLLIKIGNPNQLGFNSECVSTKRLFIPVSEFLSLLLFSLFDFLILINLFNLLN